MNPLAGTQSSKSWWELGGLLVGVLLCLLPFVNKAVHIDDPLFIWVAHRITVRWWDFFGGQINWYGAPMPASEVVMNPPLMSFYLAGAAGLSGWGERVLHGALLVPALGAVAGTYFLARRMCEHPALATAAAVFSPVFIVSSTTIMCDVSMTCLFVWAIYFWVCGVQKRRQWMLATGACLALGAALTKYFAVSLVPLLGVYLILSRRKLGWELLWLLIPVLGMVGYQAWTYELYGVGSLGNAAKYATQWREKGPSSGRPRVLTGLSFVGGCLLTAMPAVIALMSRKGRWVYVIVGLVLLGGIFGLDLPLIEGYDAGTGMGAGKMMELAIFSASGVFILGMAIRELGRMREADAVLLGLGILGTFVFVIGLNWTVSARTVLPMTPLVGIVIARQVGTRRLARGLMGSVIGLLPVSLGLAYADYRVCGASREASEIIRDRTQGQVVWFQGHWGFQYYMQGWGARALDAQGTVCEPGDFMVVPATTSNVYPVPAGAVTEVARLELWQARGVTTLDLKLGAGFYSDVSGPLPFAFGVGAPVTFDVFRIEHTLRYSEARKGK